MIYKVQDVYVYAVGLYLIIRLFGRWVGTYLKRVLLNIQLQICKSSQKRRPLIFIIMLLEFLRAWRSFIFQLAVCTISICMHNISYHHFNKLLILLQNVSKANVGPASQTVSQHQFNAAVSI